MGDVKRTPKDMAEAIIFATNETNRLLGTLMGVQGSVMDDAAVVSQAMLDLLAALTAPTWLVWSNEHRAWWSPNRCGYCWDVSAAGRYTLEEAQKICGERGVERGDGINPPELIQPSPEWLAARAAAIKKAEGCSPR